MGYDPKCKTLVEIGLYITHVVNIVAVDDLGTQGGRPVKATIDLYAVYK